ncbi:MAG TPA: TonB-dependent receptor [Caulobacteraceae bacterium]
MNKQVLLISCALSALVLSAGGAYAATATAAATDTAPATAVDANGGSGIGELVVTAEKREQNLQDVPVAITAFTSAKRDLIGLNTIQDFTNFTPGLQYSQASDKLSLRGIGRLTNVHAADGGVAIYSDGVYTSSTTEAGKSPLFVDRVEVLRGPQGTLYGRNAIAGAVNIISVRPTKDPYAEIRAEYSNYNRYLIQGAVSGPLSDNVQFRLAASEEKQTRGYLHNTYIDPVTGKRGSDEGQIINQYYVEGQLQFQLNDKFDGWAKLGVFYWNNKGGGPGTGSTYVSTPYPTFETGVAALTQNPGYAYSGNATNVITGCSPVNPTLTNVRDFCSNTARRDKLNDTVVFASQFNYHGDGFDVRYIAGGTHYHYSLEGPNTDPSGVSQYTLPCSPAPVYPGAPNCLYGSGPLTIYPTQNFTYQEVEHWFSNELNIVSTSNSPLQYVVGAYEYAEGYQQPVTAGDPGQPQLANPTSAVGAPSIPNPSRNFYDDRPVLNIRSYAGFGQVDWKATDTLKFTGGLRYSYDHKFGSESVRVICFAVTACEGGTVPEILGNYTPAIDLTQVPSVVSNGRNALGQPAPPPGVVGPTVYNSQTGFATRFYDAHWSALTGTAGVEWTPNADTLLYAKYSRGYKAGGFDIGIGTTLGPSPETNPEHVNSYEIGFKKDFGRTLQTNVSLFYYDYTDAQVPIDIVSTAGGLTSANAVFFNVPKAVSEGVELEAVWQPVDNLQILFDYSYLDAHITQADGLIDPSDPAALDPRATPDATVCTAATCAADIYTVGLPNGGFQRGQNLKGDHLPNSPKNKFALNVNYTIHLEAGTLTPTVSYVWRDAQYGSIFDRADSRAPSWDQVDARLTFKSANGKYTLIGYVKNIFNTIGYDNGAIGYRKAGTSDPSGFPYYSTTGVNFVQGNSTTYEINPPRLYGIELQYKFF